MKLTKNRLLRQLIKYTFAGGIAFVMDIGSLYLLTEFAHIHYLISTAIAFLIGLSTNYIISINWVFDQRTVSNKKVEFLIFGMIGVLGLGMNELVIWVFTEKVGLFYINSKLIATAIVYFFNFFVRKFTLFKDSPNLEIASETINE
jgi:putative flippase GtrA